MGVLQPAQLALGPSFTAPRLPPAPSPREVDSWCLKAEADVVVVVLISLSLLLLETYWRYGLL